MRSCIRNKSLFGSFSSEKEQESSFSEEKAAKRLLFLRCAGKEVR
jgi:hypothetical protein